MSRKPANKLRPNETRQAIWEWIRNHTRVNATPVPFILRDINVLLAANSIRDYLTGLTHAGFLVATKASTRLEATSYTLVKDNGQEAPRVRKDGSMVTQGLAREKMWIAMGIHSQKGTLFTVRDLTIGSTPEIPIAESDAKQYCIHLHQNNYLTIAKPGGPGRLAVYRMAPNKWTGPKPVQIQRTRRCYDPNTGAVAHIDIISVEGGE